MRGALMLTIEPYHGEANGGVSKHPQRLRPSDKRRVYRSSNRCVPESRGYSGRQCNVMFPHPDGNELEAITNRALTGG